jgi:hypothetical protein
MFVRFTAPNEQDVALVYQGDNQYRALVSLEVNVQPFKIADIDLSPTTTFSRSSEEAQFINLGAATPLVISTDENHQTLLIVSAAGDYQFDLDATDATSPVLTVTLAP